MPTLRITKEFRFEAAHALTGYDGKCRHLHGHSYILNVTVAGEPLARDGAAKNGMVLDFTVLKSIVNQHIIDIFDHCLILREGAPLAEDIAKSYPRVHIVPFQPTTEGLICHFANILQDALPQEVSLHSLRLHESPTSYVEWFAHE